MTRAPANTRSRKPRRGGSRNATPPPHDGTASGAAPLPWLIVSAIFIAGILARLIVFSGPHLDGDEIIYQALVQQLDRGQGYTLQGTGLIGPQFPAEQYGQALFFHPPGGIAYFWVLSKVLGSAAFPIAQVLSYAIFFWSMMLLGSFVLSPLTTRRAVLLATLTAFTPIMSHVCRHYWLDGPLLAFTTGACALFMMGVARDQRHWTVGAGVLLGFASLIKVTAFLVVPGLLLVAWMGCPPARRVRLIQDGVAMLFAAVVIQLPWEVWQLDKMGTLFWSGRPSQELIDSNRYVRFLTVDRSPWIYVQLLPRAVWTLVPSVLSLLVLKLERGPRRIGIALAAWVALIVGVHVLLGYMGYSKLLRYIILVTPATLLLFALTADRAAQWARDAQGSLRRSLAVSWAVLVAAGLVLEVIQGIVTPIYHMQLITPLF